MRQRGFTLTEMLVAVLLLGIVLGLLMFNGRQGMANREFDRAAKELESAMLLTRQLATNRNGATLQLVSGDGTNDARYFVVAGGVTEREGRLHRSIQLAGEPSLTLVFRSNGSLEREHTITVSSNSTGRRATLTVRAATGAVQVSTQG